MSSHIAEHYFSTRAEASLAAAQQIVTLLQGELAAGGAAAMVVTGGSSPQQCYQALAEQDLAWANVQLLLSDERWVSPQDPDSNERMLRETLLQGAAAAATLLPVYAADCDIDSRCQDLTAQLSQRPAPFAATLLGMGSDGHIASLFPDAANLDIGLDPAAGRGYVPVTTAASPHPRVSMTLAALLRSRAVLLLFFGEDKRDVFEQAMNQAQSYPVSALLQQQQVPVHVFWAA